MKFDINQNVRVVSDREGQYAPKKGAIGKVLIRNRVGHPYNHTYYIVMFNMDQQITVVFEEIELEACNVVDAMINDP